MLGEGCAVHACRSIMPKREPNAAVSRNKAKALEGMGGGTSTAAAPNIVASPISAIAPPSFVASQSRIAPPMIARRAGSEWAIASGPVTSMPGGKRERPRIAPPSAARPLTSVTFFSVSAAL